MDQVIAEELTTVDERILTDGLAPGSDEDSNPFLALIGWVALGLNVTALLLLAPALGDPEQAVTRLAPALAIGGAGTALLVVWAAIGAVSWRLDRSLRVD